MVRLWFETRYLSILKTMMEISSPWGRSINKTRQGDLGFAGFPTVQAIGICGGFCGVILDRPSPR